MVAGGGGLGLQPHPAYSTHAHGRILSFFLPFDRRITGPLQRQRCSGPAVCSWMVPAHISRGQRLRRSALTTAQLQSRPTLSASPQGPPAPTARRHHRLQLPVRCASPRSHPPPRLPAHPAVWQETKSATASRLPTSSSPPLGSGSRRPTPLPAWCLRTRRAAWRRPRRRACECAAPTSLPCLAKALCCAGRVAGRVSHCWLDLRVAPKGPSTPFAPAAGGARWSQIRSWTLRCMPVPIRWAGVDRGASWRGLCRAVHCASLVFITCRERDRTINKEGGLDKAHTGEEASPRAAGAAV